MNCIKVEFDDCPECGVIGTDFYIEINCHNYCIYYTCEHCGLDEMDAFADVFGVMSEPSGFLM